MERYRKTLLAAGATFLFWTAALLIMAPVPGGSPPTAGGWFPGGEALGDTDLGSYDLICDNADADNDTKIVCDTDDEISIEINGAEDFRFSANSFDALGSLITDSGDQLDLGTACTDNHAGGSGDVCIGGASQFDGAAHFDTYAHHWAATYFYEGGSSHTGGIWASLDDGLRLWANAAAGYGNANVMIVPSAHWNADFNHDVTNDIPRLIVHSKENPATNDQEFITIEHDETDGRIMVNQGDLAIEDDGLKGVTTFIRTKPESVTFANDATKVTAGSILEDGALFLGVSGRVTTLLEGCTSVDVGDGTDADLFADDVALAAGTTFDHTDITAAYSTIAGGYWPRTADGEITVTANGGNCTAGVVALSVHYLDIGAATSN